MEIEVEEVLFHLAQPIADPPSPLTPDPPIKPQPTCSQFLKGTVDQLRKLAKDRDETPEDAALVDTQSKKWEQLAEVVYAWDAEIQDQLNIKSVNQLTGYNLGRALADIYWALDPAAPDNLSSSWHRLFIERRALINQYLGRLSDYFDPQAAAGISGSVATWCKVASTPRWRSNTDDTLKTLHEQLRRWYGVLILGQSPQTYVKPRAFLGNWRATLTALRAFLPDLLALAGGLGAATALGSLIALGYGAEYVKSLLGFVSAFGLTSATLTAHIKTSTQGLLTRLRSSAESDIVAIGLTLVPREKPSPSPLPHSNERAAVKAVRQAIRGRGIGAAVGEAA